MIRILPRRVNRPFMVEPFPEIGRPSDKMGPRVIPERQAGGSGWGPRFPLLRRALGAWTVRGLNGY